MSFVYDGGWISQEVCQARHHTGVLEKTWMSFPFLRDGMIVSNAIFAL